MINETTLKFIELFVKLYCLHNGIEKMTAIIILKIMNLNIKNMNLNTKKRSTKILWRI